MISLNLDHTFCFYNWHAKVLKTLRAYKLYHLNDSSIERPLCSDPDAGRCFKFSVWVSRWMMSCIRLVFGEEVLLRGRDIEFADGFMRDLREFLDCESQLQEDRVLSHLKSPAG
ncbi:uncharacterized protein N7529_011969 [Penicillium soppii]|jgi:hypothetical protein|uniref:uncharacterized protein n=1 Tax=Penicillium soppii TaxID=69789 RepID=UPI0025467A7A|nr:uncharacterized protein N7529_011969 [Penicillium soppii]KAJ5852584.1 hypothetical protein N7529_011969 [Penicillium soppii]